MASVILQNPGKYMPARLRLQREQRRSFHQRAYPNIYVDLLREDGWSALLSLFKSYLHTSYSMESRVYWIIPPDHGWGIPGIPYPDDDRFPIDPWKKE